MTSPPTTRASSASRAVLTPWLPASSQSCIPVCAVALRICLTPEDEGTHELGLSIVDADGTPLDKERMPIKINFPVPAFPEGASFFTRNLIMNFQGLRFEKPGNYSIDLTVDGELASRVPFRVVQVQEEAAQA